MESVENDVISLKIEENIIYGKYLVEKIDLEVAKKAVETRLKLQNGKEFLGVFDSSNLKVITSDARKYLTQPISYKGLKVSAFIIKSPIGAVLGNFYLAFGKFPIPTKLFRTEAQAVEWVNNQAV